MTNEAMDRAVRALRDSASFVVSGHIGPDGDALGSALAFAHAARLAGKQAVVAFGGAFVMPDSYSYLDTTPVVDLPEVPSNPEAMVVFDVGVESRIAEMAETAANAGVFVVVDHHPNPDEGWGDIQVIDTDAGAAAQLCFELIKALGWPIDENVGRCLLTGIVTDTGRFQYSSTDGEIMRIAADLLDAGVRPEMIGQAVYESVPFGYLKVSSAVLGRAVLDEDLGFIWSAVYISDLAEAGVDVEDIDPLIDDLRIAKEAGVALLLKETADGFKGSMRSRGVVDVGAIAASEGGGGHRNAAGFTSSDSVGRIVDRVRASLRG